MTFVVGMRIQGEASSARRALDETAGGLDRVNQASRRAQPGIGAVEAHARRAGTSVEGWRQRMVQAPATIERMRAETQRLAEQARGAGRDIDGAAAAKRRLEAQARATSGGLKQTEGSLKAIGQAAAMAGGPIGGVVGQFAALTSGASRLGIAGAAAALAGGAIVAGARAWKDYALQIDDVARAAGASRQQLAALQAAASFRGIGRDEWATGMQQFARHVDKAERGMGSLAQLFRANNVQARGFEQHLARAADLIANARSDHHRLQLLAQMGLPSTMQWVRLLEGGSEGLRKARGEAEHLGNLVNDRLVEAARSFDSGWNTTWTNFELYGKGAVAGVLESGWRLISSLPGTVQRAWELATGTGLPAGAQHTGPTMDTAAAGRFYDAFRGHFGVQGGRTRDDEEQKHHWAQEQAGIAILGQLANVQQQVRLQQIAINQARAIGVPITQDSERRILDYARAQALGLVQIEQQTAALKREVDAMRMATGAAAAYRAEKQIVDGYSVAGITLKEQEIAAIRAKAQALGAATQTLEDYRARMQAADAVGSTLADGFIAWSTGARGLQETINDLTQSLARMAMQATLVGQGPLAGLFGMGNSGGLFGALLRPVFGTAGGMNGQGMGLFDAGSYTGAMGRDRIAGWVHGQEFVVNAAATARHRPLLEAINDNRIPDFATGGYVPAPPPRSASSPATAWSAGSPAPAQPVRIEVSVYVDDDGRLGAIAREAGREGGSGAAQVQVNTFSERVLPHRLIEIQRHPRRRG